MCTETANGLSKCMTGSYAHVDDFNKILVK